MLIQYICQVLYNFILTIIIFYTIFHYYYIYSEHKEGEKQRLKGG